MTDSSLNSSPQPRGVSTAALVLGILSLLGAIFFVSTLAGPIPLIISGVAGLAALVVGIIALSKRQPKWPAILGLIVGTLVLLFALALFVFALLFVGAMSLESM